MNLIYKAKQTFVEIELWHRARPKFVLGIATALTCLFLTLAIKTAFSDTVDWIDVALLLLMMLGEAMMIYGAAKLIRPVVLILCLSLLGTPTANAQTPPEEPLAWFVAGAVVFLLVGGVVIGCRAKKCLNKVPQRTNAWPAELNFHVAGGPMNYGAAFSEGELGYCALERGIPEPTVVFTLFITVESETNAAVTMKADVGEEYVESLWEWRGDLEVIGLELVHGPGRMESYSRNGAPVFAEQVPIRYNWNTRTATFGDGGVLVTVEASDNLRDWSPLHRFNVEVGSLIEVPDATDMGMQFYRVTTGRP